MKALITAIAILMLCVGCDKRSEDNTFTLDLSAYIGEGAKIPRVENVCIEESFRIGYFELERRRLEGWQVIIRVNSGILEDYYIGWGDTPKEAIEAMWEDYRKEVKKKCEEYKRLCK